MSRTSAPPRCTRFGREVDGEVGGLDHRLLLGRRGAPQRGPEAGQQLVHPERLGDVVVGAGVEGERPCRVSPSRTDSTTIGTVLHPRSPRITSTPSMPGSPRSSTTTSGWWPAASVERVLAVGREVDVVAAGAQVDPERAQDLRLVVDDQHARHVARRAG